MWLDVEWCQNQRKGRWGYAGVKVGDLEVGQNNWSIEAHE